MWSQPPRRRRRCTPGGARPLQQRRRQSCGVRRGGWQTPTRTPSTPPPRQRARAVRRPRRRKKPGRPRPAADQVPWQASAGAAAGPPPPKPATARSARRGCPRTRSPRTASVALRDRGGQGGEVAEPGELGVENLRPAAPAEHHHVVLVTDRGAGNQCPVVGELPVRGQLKPQGLLCREPVRVPDGRL